MKALVLTPGEPAGIGPDLMIRISQQRLGLPIVCVASRDLLIERAKVLGIKIQVTLMEQGLPSRPARPGEIYLRHIPLNTPCTIGRLDPDNARYVLSTLDTAVDGCLKGQYAALVTGPIQKSIINDAGIPFSGHTEYLAQLTGGSPVMMLAAPGLRVALVTTHLPLSQVPAAITTERLTRVIEVLHQDLIQRFRIQRPRIMVAGLNPHAGEGGHLGREEIEIIQPVLEEFRQREMRIVGPLPADTLFSPGYLKEADAVLAMYHDQGLPVLKHMGFGKAVNITLGLPILRTSVDHGTAVDLAGTSRVSTGSMVAAIRQAAVLAGY